MQDAITHRSPFCGLRGAFEQSQPFRSLCALGRKRIYVHDSRRLKTGGKHALIEQLAVFFECKQSQINFTQNGEYYVIFFILFIALFQSDIKIIYVGAIQVFAVGSGEVSATKVFTRLLLNISITRGWMGVKFPVLRNT